MIDPRQPDYRSTPFAPSRPNFAYAPLEPLGADLKPVVSVVTPFFDTGEVFRETAKSVLGQSLQQFEWIIVNDASSDPASLRILDEYRAMAADPARVGPRIRIIDHRTNLGLAATRNTGYRHAMADLVFQLDSDDLIEPTTLEKCAWRLHSHPREAFTKGKTVGFDGDGYLWDKGFHDGVAFREENLATATAMIRRSTWRAVGGFDETIRGGMEDWDFWLRCAEAGLWGLTVNEYLDWYRRRANQHADWQNLATQRGMERFRGRLRDVCPRVCSGYWPSLEPHWAVSMETLREEPPFSNLLAKPEGRRRLLLVIPWMRMGGADRFNLDLLKCLTTMGDGSWDITVVTTVWTHDDAHHPVGLGNEWAWEFTRYTPDVFMTHNYVRIVDAPVFVEYLIKSRRPDVVMVSNSRMGYQLLPYLRQRCPEPAFVDFNHMEEAWWKNGGHPRTGVGYQGMLELSITVSRHLKEWMVDRGADERRIQTCYINADTQRWRPDRRWRQGARAEIGLDADVPIVLYAARLCAQKQPMVFADTIRRVRDMLDPQWESRTEAFDRAHGTWAQRRDALDAEWKAWRKHVEDNPRAQAPPKPGPIKRPIPRFVAVVAGEGELLQELTAYCERHRLLDSGHVVLVGGIATDAMPGYMAASDIFFLPSKWEGIALSIYEAMSSGLAVLGADVGGQRELVTHDTGILMPGPDECQSPDIEAQGYAYALARLLLDGDLRASMGRAGRARIQRHFELDHMRSRMLELFDRALELKERDPRETVAKDIARELATTAVEFARVDALNEELWAIKVQAEARAMSPAAERSNEPCTPAPDLRVVVRELEIIERSRAWRTVQRFKALAPYQTYARLRWGPDWHTVEFKAPPEQRLDRIRASRSYRLIQVMKRNPAYAAFARWRYGD